MQQGFLADDRIHGLSRQRDLHDVTAHDAHALRKADPSRKIRRARCTMRIEFDASDYRAVLVGEIARRTSEPRAKIRDLAAAADARAFGQRVHDRQPAVVVLVIGKQILRREPVEVAAPGSELRENLVSRNRMAAVKRQDVMIVGHEACGRWDDGRWRRPVYTAGHAGRAARTR